MWEEGLIRERAIDFMRDDACDRAVWINTVHAFDFSTVGVTYFQRYLDREKNEKY